MTKSDLYEILAGYRLGVLGTIGPDGRPQSALVGIAVTPRLDIIFDTVDSSRKYANLMARPACSFVVGGWNTGKRTIQFEGDAEVVTEPDLDGFREAYFKTWPDGAERMSWSGIVHFAVRPRWIRYTEYGVTQVVKEFEFTADC